MSDYIDREYLVDHIHACMENDRLMLTATKEEILQMVADVPSAESERKIELHGDESAIEILSELRSWFSCFDKKEGLAYHALSLAIRAIKANHAARLERKKGEWHGKGDSEGFGIFICDNCGKFAMMEYDFCPNCGADMRGEQE